jgi:ribosomal protein L4
MELKITTLDGKAAGSVTLSDAIFGLEPRTAVSSGSSPSASAERTR